MTHASPRRRAFASTVPLLVAALLAAPLPALADEAVASMPGPGQPTLHAQAKLAVANLAPTLRSSSTPQTATEPATTDGRDRWSFFKSPVGIAVMATFAVGAGYAIYSTQNDRITSPGK